MNQSINETGGTGPSHRGVEIGVAAVIALIGAVAIFGSLKVGVGWGSDGPQAGFFPFYCGLAVLISCAVNIAIILRDTDEDARFANWRQLRQVLSVVIPTTVYVFIIPVLGIYLSSAILIVGFMMWLGKYPLHVATAIGIGMPIVTFAMFEIWFLVPLPKGPIERLLGY